MQLYDVAKIYIICSSCIHHIIMSTLYEGHTDQMHPYLVSTGLITCTSPLIAITFCQVSLNPMAVPKPILLRLKGSPERSSKKKKESEFFAKVKVHL